MKTNRVSAWASSKIFLTAAVGFMLILALRACTVSVMIYTPTLSRTEQQLAWLQHFMETHRCR